MSHIYHSVVPFQVLQRDLNTNLATLIINGNKFTLPIGGPFTVNECPNVYVGDIWIMAGQSNMRGHGFLYNPFNNQLLETPKANRVCLYDSSENWREASEPTHSLVSSPRAVHQELPDPTVTTSDICKWRGASLGMAFAKEYQGLNNGIPVGLVACAHGGTSLHDWERPKEIDQDTVQNTLYGAMIDKIRAIGGHVAGVLWFQGETDAGELKASETYGRRFQDWLDDLRKDTRMDMPVAFVQIGSHRVNIPHVVKGWENIQDHQRHLFGYQSITAGVASLDCSLDDRVHISTPGLIKVGRRLANAAVQAMMKRAETATPLCKSAEFEQKELMPSVLVYSIKLTFDHMEMLEWTQSEQLGGFDLENCSNHVTITSTRIEGKEIRLYLTGKPATLNTVYVTYGMNKPMANVVTTSGSALPAFKKMPISYE